jgi:outer membrane protein
MKPTLRGLTCLLLCVSAPALAQPLLDLQARALDGDPGVRAARAQAQVAGHRVHQAQAAFGPTATLTGNSSRTRYTELPEADLRVFRADQWAVQVNLPLLRGSLWPALETAQAQQQQAEAALAQARADAMQRFVEALLEVLKARDARSHADVLHEAQAEQLAAVRRSYQVGRAAVTEVREAEARRDIALAQYQAADADLDLRQQVLAELTGQPAPGLLGRALGVDALPSLEGEGVHDWLARALAGNPNVRQAELALDAAQAEARRAQLAHAPTLEGNVTWSRSSDSGTTTTFFPRRGNSSAIGVTLTVPLFAGGATQSRVEESLALVEKARAELDLARRTLNIGVRQAYVTVMSAVAQARSLAAAERSQALSLRANQRGYEIGMRVNADVLDAQGKLFEARRDMSRARHEAWAGWFRLRALSGALVEADMLRLEALLADAPPAATLRGRQAQP